MRKRGYFLIEALCYIVIATVLLYFLNQQAVHAVSSIQKAYKTHVQTTQLYSAQWLLERDLMAAPRKITAWITTDATALIWREGEIYKSYTFKDDRLFRITGTYNQKNNSWVKKNKYLVARSLKSLEFLLDKNGSDVTAVSYKLISKNDAEIKQYIQLQNRIV